MRVRGGNYDNYVGKLLLCNFPRAPKRKLYGTLHVSADKLTVYFVHYDPRTYGLSAPYSLADPESLNRKCHVMRRGDFIYVKGVTSDRSLKDPPNWEALFQLERNR